MSYVSIEHKTVIKKQTVLKECDSGESENYSDTNFALYENSEEIKNVTLDGIDNVATSNSLKRILKIKVDTLTKSSTTKHQHCNNKTDSILSFIFTGNATQSQDTTFIVVNDQLHGCFISKFIRVKLI